MCVKLMSVPTEAALRSDDSIRNQVICFSFLKTCLICVTIIQTVTSQGDSLSFIFQEKKKFAHVM